MSSITDELFGLSPCLLSPVVGESSPQNSLAAPGYEIERMDFKKSSDNTSANIRFPFIQSNESAADFHAENWTLVRNHMPVSSSRFPRASSKLADGIVGRSH